MAKTRGKAGQRATVARRTGRQARKAGPSKRARTALHKPEPTKSKAKKQKASTASEFARLKRQLQAARRQQQATADVLKVISRSSFDLQAVFDSLVNSAAQLCEAQSAFIFRREGEVFRLRSSVGFQPHFRDFMARHPIEPGRGTLVGKTALTRNMVHIPDVQTDPEYAWTESRELGGYRTMLGVPLLREGVAIGVLAMTRDEPQPFTDKQIELLQTFADQAVIAIENTRLFNEVQAKTADLEESLQQQTATAEVLKIISRSAFDLQAVFDTLIGSAVDLVGALNGTICLREGNGYRYLATSGIGHEFGRFLAEHPPKPGRASAAGRVILSGRVERISDVLEDNEYIVPAFDLNRTRSVLGVPLLRDDSVEGALVLARAEPGPFTQQQIDIVQTFADQAVIAIQNARLFNEVQERTKELSASLDELRATQDRLIQTEKLASLGQLTAGIAHEIKNPLNFVNNFSALSVELTGELNDTLKQATLADQLRNEVDELTGLLKSNLEKIVQHGKRADSIVKNMLLHSREGSGERRSAEINRLVEESLNLAYHGARAEKPGFMITLKHELDPEAGVLDLYPQEMTRALLNLISNGFYAATKRKTEAGDQGFEPILSAATRNLGTTVEIRIRDNGSGISPEVREKMFNPFFTTKPTGEGTGLGLSMTHDIIVKQHGGLIDVETEPGAYTEFIITLPRGNGTTAKAE
jgi:two-component system, NtrC family, sensor kinase